MNLLLLDPKVAPKTKILGEVTIDGRRFRVVKPISGTVVVQQWIPPTVFASYDYQSMSYGCLGNRQGHWRHMHKSGPLRDRVLRLTKSLGLIS